MRRGTVFGSPQQEIAMRRLALVLAVVLASAVQASAAPGDAEFDAWRAAWVDANGVMVFPNPTGLFYGYLSFENLARQQLAQIMFDYPGTVAARKAQITLDYWNLWPKRS
jgi:hypothetical protein